MHRALFWKEWRQLALVRWGGIALGAVLPVAFTAGAELAQRGLLPTGRVDAYAPRDLMYELLPAALALGLWPLIALMSAAQVFSGDRAAGTESFLLERPVPRTAVWRARLLASLANLAVVIAGTAAVAASAAALTGPPPAVGWSRWVILALVGVGVALLAYFGSMVAASLLPAPMGAVLLGAVIGAVPALLVAQLSALFPYARVGGVFLGAVLPVFLLPAFVWASWVAFCRGEPAGRGRIKRAATVLGGTLVGVAVLFVALAPVATRANARRGQHSIFPSPFGQSAFVGAITNTAWGGGWIVDTATGEKRGFVPPPVQYVAWNPDGSEIAIVTWSGPLGSVKSSLRIDIRSTRDGRLVRSFPIEKGILALTWAKDGLVAILTTEASPKSQHVSVEILDPKTGARHATGFEAEGWTLHLIGPTADGRVLLRELVEDGPPGGTARPRGYNLRPIDVAARRIGPVMADPAGAALKFAGWSGGLSPTGRFARVVVDDAGKAGPVILDLGNHSVRTTGTVPPWARWLPDDRLVWRDDLAHRTRMFLGRPGEPPTPLREWRDAQVGIEPSPGGQALFVSVIPAPNGPAIDPERARPDPSLFDGSIPAGASPEELIYLVEENRFITLGPPFSSQPNDLRYTQWAGRKTLARVAPGVVAFEDMDAPGHRRFVIGGPSDLE